MTLGLAPSPRLDSGAAGARNAGVRKPLALLPFLVLAACASTSDAMKSWVGSTDAELMAQRGAPDRETTAAGGVRILTYNGRNGYGQIICQQTFTLRDGRVAAWSHNCPL